MLCYAMLDVNARKFLQLLLERAEEGDILLNMNDICPSMFSLQYQSSHTPEIRSLLSYIERSFKVSNTNAHTIPAKTLCSAIYGLKKMKPEVEIRQLLIQVAVCMDKCDTYYHSINVCIALNGEIKFIYSIITNFTNITKYLLISFPF